MQSICFSSLVLIALLGACSSFLIPSPGPRQAMRPPRHMFVFGAVSPFPPSRGQETARSATDEGDDDGIDYSADPITAFLGKFLPSGKEKSETPQARDLVSILGNSNLRSAAFSSAVHAQSRLVDWSTLRFGC